jgi:hypothetical protein
LGGDDGVEVDRSPPLRFVAPVMKGTMMMGAAEGTHGYSSADSAHLCYTKRHNVTMPVAMGFLAFSNRHRLSGCDGCKSSRNADGARVVTL